MWRRGILWLAKRKPVLVLTHFLLLIIIAPTFAVTSAALIVDPGEGLKLILLGFLVAGAYSFLTSTLAISFFLLLNRHGTTAAKRIIILTIYTLQLGGVSFKISDRIEHHEILGATALVMGALCSILLYQLWTAAQSLHTHADQRPFVFKMPESVHWTLLSLNTVTSIYFILLCTGCLKDEKI